MLAFGRNLSMMKPSLALEMAPLAPEGLQNRYSTPEEVQMHKKTRKHWEKMNEIFKKFDQVPFFTI